MITMTDKRQSAEDSLVEWAENAELKPRRVRRGNDAAAAGRALLEAAGVDVEQVERNVGGRPRLGGGPKGTRSPRLNVAISEDLDLLLDELERQRGVSRSTLVREALDRYLRDAG